MRKCFLILILLIGLVIAKPPAGKGKPPKETVDHTALQTRPIELGTSGGNIEDISQYYCCGGTLGTLVTDINGVSFILSNNHVLALTNRGLLNDRIVQPGLNDYNCQSHSSLTVGYLSAFVPIDFSGGINFVDAAVAITYNHLTSNSILELSTPGTVVVDPSVRLAVQKSGRTTGVTKGRIEAVGVNIWVTYNEECGVGSQVAYFTNQVRIRARRGAFSRGGDSGSLIVTNDDEKNPVALLFAGDNRGNTYANTMRDVLYGLEEQGIVIASPSLTSIQATFPQQAQAARDRNEARFMSLPKVVGTGITLKTTGVIEVYVTEDTPSLRKHLPHVGVPLRIIEVEEIIAQ
jgi:hypothetical protein